MSNQKALSIIIPCYGKRNEIVERTILSTEQALIKFSDKLEVFFVYKNSDKFNYDWTTKYKDINVIKVDSPTCQKTFKVLTGLENSNSKYSYILDADDLLITDDIEKILDSLINKNNDVILLNLFSANENDLNKTKYKKTYDYKSYKKTINSNFPWHHSSLTANTIYKTDFLLRIYRSMNDIVLKSEDIYRSLKYIHATKNISNENYVLCKYIFYNNEIDSARLTLNKRFEEVFIIIEDILSIPINEFAKENKKIIKRDFQLLLFDLFIAYKNTKNVKIKENWLIYKKNISKKYKIKFLSMFFIMFYMRLF